MSKQYTLITGRTPDQGEGLHRGRESEAYRQATALVEMAAGDMAELGLASGQLVELRTPAGRVRVPVQPGDLPAGLLFMPLGPAANQLIGAETDSTGMPAFKGLTTEIETL